MCVIEKAYANEFVWELKFTLKDQVLNQRTKTLDETVEIDDFQRKFWIINIDHFRKRKRTRTILVRVTKK